MAQSSNALREPTTDEILASIREIIEENTGRISMQSGDKANDFKKRNEADSSSFSSNNFENRDALTVEDAMRALAARIGLKENRQSKSTQPVEKNMSGNTPSPEQTSENVAVSNQNEKIINDDRVIPDYNKGIAGQQNIENLQNKSASAAVQKEQLQGALELSPAFWASVDRLAADALRPILVNWLQKRWPALVEKILHEELIHAFERNFPSEKK